MVNAININHIVTNLVVNFAKNLKAKMAEELREKVKINITPSIDYGEITLTFSCYNTEYSDFVESMLRVSFYSLSEEAEVPISLATRFEEPKEFLKPEQLDNELNRLLDEPIYVNILETVATRGVGL